MNIPASSLIASLTEIQSGFAYLWPELILSFFFLLVVGLDLWKSPAIKALLPPTSNNNARLLRGTPTNLIFESVFTAKTSCYLEKLAAICLRSSMAPPSWF